MVIAIVGGCAHLCSGVQSSLQPPCAVSEPGCHFSSPASDHSLPPPPPPIFPSPSSSSSSSSNHSLSPLPTPPLSFTPPPPHPPPPPPPSSPIFPLPLPLLLLLLRSFSFPSPYPSPILHHPPPHLPPPLLLLLHPSPSPSLSPSSPSLLPLLLLLLLLSLLLLLPILHLSSLPLLCPHPYRHCFPLFQSFPPLLPQTSTRAHQVTPVLVIGATNRPDSLEPALRRAGPLRPRDITGNSWRAISREVGWRPYLLHLASVYVHGVILTLVGMSRLTPDPLLPTLPLPSPSLFPHSFHLPHTFSSIPHSPLPPMSLLSFLFLLSPQCMFYVLCTAKHMCDMLYIVLPVLYELWFSVCLLLLRTM